MQKPVMLVWRAWCWWSDRSLAARSLALFPAANYSTPQSPPIESVSYLGREALLFPPSLCGNIPCSDLIPPTT